MNIKKTVSLVLTLVIALTALTPVIALAQGTPDFGTGYLGGTTLPDEDVRNVAVNLINILLGVLGIIFLLLVLYGGFLWMTAGGNDDQASKGRKIIGNGIIGLIVIFVAFAITTFVFNILSAAA